MNEDNIGLWGLFGSAFLSSTLLPGSSEVLLAYLVTTTQHPPSLLMVIATLGNTLGGFTSYWLGRFFAYRFPNQPLREKHQLALTRIQHWGSFSLLLSWVPIIGDPLCVAAGYVKVNPWFALLLLAIGKAARYVFVILVTPTILST